MPTVSVKKLLAQAKSALDAKDFDGALKASREVLKIDKQNYHVYVLIGVATIGRGDLPRALQSYQRAIKIRPDLPLAYKGVIDALSEKAQPEHRLILARAHLELGRISARDADKSLPIASNMLYSLAIKDPSLTSEAVDAMHEVQRGNFSLPSEQTEETIYRIARLLCISSKSRPEKEPEGLIYTLEASPLSEALDAYTKLLNHGPRPPSEVDVAKVVVQRAVLRCLREDNFEANLRTLRQAGAYEAILEVAELDKATMIKGAERALISSRHVHLYPFAMIGTRSKYILAAELFRNAKRLDVSSSLAGLDGTVTARQTGNFGKMLMSSCTHAVVSAYLHLVREEHKLVCLAVAEGRTLTDSTKGKKRCNAFFNLLNAAALCGERKYRNALELYNRARLYGHSNGHSWIENASNQGIVATSVLAYGRNSRQASTAVEEAAGSSSSMFGVLESTWSDALAGDVDLLRMEELANEVTELSHSNHVSADFFEWECSLLDTKFVKSIREIAAISKTRLAQMILVETGYTNDGLTTAKRRLMEAASLFKESPDPFAHLGYIFEQLAARNDSDRMLSRAIRCYEKGIVFDPAHPVASRRLARLLFLRGLRSDASTVSRRASQRDPKARWAHNLTGWVRLMDGRPIDAAVSFRDAIRGRPRRTFREEEAIFGTSVGQTEDDNCLIIDVDSWRGLSAAYTKVGKLGPATACIDDALALTRAPPKLYMTTASANMATVQKQLLLILEAEKTLLLLSQTSTSVHVRAMDSFQNSIVSLPLIQYTLSNALIELAAEEWLKGCYSRATRFRQKAVQLMTSSVEILAKRHPEKDQTPVLKRLGDALMETVTHDPLALGKLIGKAFSNEMLQRAATVYAKAMHLSPWQRIERIQDVVAAMSRAAHSKGDKRVATCAATIAASTKLEPQLTSISLLEAQALTKNIKLRSSAVRIAQKISSSAYSHSSLVELSTTISCHGREVDVGTVVDSAVAAVRRSPGDWKAWYAVGRVREADASQRKWPQGITKSCEEAYREADRLGGGPTAVAGRVRCDAHLVDDYSRESEVDALQVFSYACLCVSNAARIGTEEPDVCSDVIERHKTKMESTAANLFRHLSAQQACELQRNFHLFPFLEVARGSFQLLHEQVIPH